MRNELDRENAGTAPCEILIPTRSINGVAVSPVPKDLAWRDAREVGMGSMQLPRHPMHLVQLTEHQHNLYA